MRLLSFSLTFIAGAVSMAALSTCWPVASAQSRSPHPDPISIVETLFDAARTGRFEALASLCPPSGDHDDAIGRICELQPGTPDATAFVELFATGSVAGPIRRRAEVPIAFGPGGTQRERLELIERDGQWYLFTF